MKRTPLVASLCIGLLVVLGACGGDPTGDDPSFRLTFTGDVSFQGPHAGQLMKMALIRNRDGAEIVSGSGTVSAPPDTMSFYIKWENPLELNEAYQIHYWIDSNFGGGTVAVCDPPAIDHQWNVPVPAVTRDIDILVSHDATTVTDVCSTFAP